MRREITLRKLRMGCGEGLFGRVLDAPRCATRARPSRSPKTAVPQTGKDKQ